MGKEEIVARILTDAETEAETIEREAKEKAEQLVFRAKEAAKADGERAKAEACAKADSVTEGKRAAARLDCAKILLSEKRRVIDAVYDRALQTLLALGEAETLALYEKLLVCYAEEGDEILLAPDSQLKKEIEALPVVQERGLTFSQEPANIEGGLILAGKNADKDVSFSALLEEDRQAHQAEIAMDLFGRETSV